VAVNTSISYDDASRITGMTHTANYNTLASYGLTWDAGSQLTQEVSNDGTVNYSYDSTGQLTGATGWRSESYSYDATGNRTMTGYSTGTGNRLLSDGNFNYTYDDEGNMLTKTEIATGKVTEYTWDYRNRLTAVTVKNSGGTVIQQTDYTYDPFDKRRGGTDEGRVTRRGDLTWWWVCTSLLVVGGTGVSPVRRRGTVSMAAFALSTRN